MSRSKSCSNMSFNKEFNTLHYNIFFQSLVYRLTISDRKTNKVLFSQVVKNYFEIEASLHNEDYIRDILASIP